MPIVRLPVPGEVPVAMLSTTEFPEPAGDSAVIGVSTYAARADHVHPKQEIDISDKLSIINPSPLGTASPGISLNAAREDHIHPGVSLSDTNPQPLGIISPGTSDEISRADHVHPRQIIDVDINTAPIKTTTAFDDFIPLIDSQSNNSLKRVKIINSIRQKLYTNLNLYVRKDGNDSNNGLTNTSGGAFLTIQAAINRSSWYDYSGSNIVINVGDGTYVESLTIYNGMQVGMGTLFIQGNTTTPANVSIRNNTAAATINMAKGTRLYLRSLKLANDGTGHCLFVQNSSICDLQSVDFGIGGASGNTIHILSRGHVNIFGNYNVTAGALRHLHVDMGGVIEITSGVVSVTGNFSGQFAFADTNGVIYTTGMTFTGSVTGQRYYALGGGCIQTYTGNVNYFPGNAAGSLGAGGYYG